MVCIKLSPCILFPMLHTIQTPVNQYIQGNAAVLGVIHKGRPHREGGGGPKSRKFCGRPLCMVPYGQKICILNCFVLFYYHIDEKAYNIVPKFWVSQSLRNKRLHITKYLIWQGAPPSVVCHRVPTSATAATQTLKRLPRTRLCYSTPWKLFPTWWKVDIVTNVQGPISTVVTPNPMEFLA